MIFEHHNSFREDNTNPVPSSCRLAGTNDESRSVEDKHNFPYLIAQKTHRGPYKIGEEANWLVMDVGLSSKGTSITGMDFLVEPISGAGGERGGEKSGPRVTGVEVVLKGDKKPGHEFQGEWRPTRIDEWRDPAAVRDPRTRELWYEDGTGITQVGDFKGTFTRFDRDEIRDGVPNIVPNIQMEDVKFTGDVFDNVERAVCKNVQDGQLLSFAEVGLSGVRLGR